MRVARSKPRPLGVKNAAEDLAIGVSGHLRWLELNHRPGLRVAAARVLAQQPRAATATVGTARGGRVVIRRVVEVLLRRFGPLRRDLGEVRQHRRLGGVGAGFQGQEDPGPARQASLGGVPQSVVADAVKAFAE